MKTHQVHNCRCNECNGVLSDLSRVELAGGKQIYVCDPCAAELAKQLTTPAEKVPEVLCFVEQRIGIKDGTAWRAFRDGGDSRYPWRIFIKGQIPCEASDEWMAENYPATETLSPTAQADRIAVLEAEVERLSASVAWAAKFLTDVQKAQANLQRSVDCDITRTIDTLKKELSKATTAAPRAQEKA